jgi:hypothetical protein
LRIEKHAIAVGFDLATSQLDEVVDADGADQGSANTSAISGSGPSEASAREAATPVAVAPTLEARSHVSFSVRGMNLHP